MNSVAIGSLGSMVYLGSTAGKFNSIISIKWLYERFLP